MKKTEVVHCNYSEYDIMIDRTSKWGNPFKIGIDGTRKEVIDKYRMWLLSNKELLDSIEELRGKRLGCWCKPKDCHGDVIVSLLENNIENIFT